MGFGFFDSSETPRPPPPPPPCMEVLPSEVRSISMYMSVCVRVTLLKAEANNLAFFLYWKEYGYDLFGLT